MEDKILIKCNNYNIIQHGTVLSWLMNPIDFMLSKDIVVRVTVISNLNDKASIETEIIEEKILNIKFVNPHVMLNFGTAEPFLIGVFSGKNLYANFRINVIRSDGVYSSYQIVYTFYQGCE